MNKDIPKEIDPEKEEKLKELRKLMESIRERKTLRYIFIGSLIWSIVYLILKFNWGYEACRIWVVVGMFIGCIMTSFGFMVYNRILIRYGVIIILIEIIASFLIFQFKLIPF